MFSSLPRGVTLMSRRRVLKIDFLSYISATERHAAYLEHSTSHFENFQTIPSILDRQVNPHDKNEANKSIEQNASGKNEPNARIVFEKTRAIKLNKLRANKKKLQEIRLHISLISKLTSKIYQHHQCTPHLVEIRLRKYPS